MFRRFSGFTVISPSPRTGAGQFPIEVLPQDDSTHCTMSLTILVPSQAPRLPIPKVSIVVLVSVDWSISSVPLPISMPIVASFIQVSRLNGRKRVLGSWQVLKQVRCSRLRSRYSSELFAQLPLPMLNVVQGISKGYLDCCTSVRVLLIPLLAAIFNGSVRASKSVTDAALSRFQ